LLYKDIAQDNFLQNYDKAEIVFEVNDLQKLSLNFREPKYLKFIGK